MLWPPDCHGHFFFSFTSLNFVRGKLIPFKKIPEGWLENKFLIPLHCIPEIMWKYELFWWRKQNTSTWGQAIQQWSTSEQNYDQSQALTVMMFQAYLNRDVKALETKLKKKWPWQLGGQSIFWWFYSMDYHTVSTKQRRLAIWNNVKPYKV